MVRNILDFYDGIIQEGFIQILTKKGFECSMSVDTAYRHGDLQWRRRVYTVITNPRYGPHHLVQPVRA